MTEETNALQGVVEETNIAEQPTETAQESAPEQTQDQQPEDKTTETKEKPVEEEPKPESKKTPWFQRRIDQLTAEKYEERREKEALKALLNKGEETKPVIKSEQDVFKLADQIAAQRLFDQKCNQINEVGTNEFPDFKDAVKTLHMVGLLKEQTTPFLELVADMPESHRMLHYLGTNPDEAERIASLSPTKQAMELARMEAKITNPVTQKQVSKATEPIKPISTSSAAGTKRLLTGDVPDPRWNNDEYREWRKTWKKDR